MALVGWRAKAASEAQLAQVGGMNAFLLDACAALPPSAPSMPWTSPPVASGPMRKG